MLRAKSSQLSIGTAQQPLTLIGRSRAGDATSFWLKELDWILDCGCIVAAGRKPRVVLISHTHQDHVSSLTHLRADDRPPQVYLPLVAAPYVGEYMQAHRNMTECRNTSNGAASDFCLNPMLPSQEFHVQQGRQFHVKTVSCCHRIDCLGYSIFEKKFRLKQEYKSLSGREIGSLHRQGVTVKEAVLDPVVCFLGDTTHKIFDTHPEILHDHRIIILECTFLHEQDLDRAAETTHMHWKYLEPVVRSHPDTFFVLIHFSLKYKSLEILQTFSEYDNVHPMLIQDEIDSEFWREQRKKGELSSSESNNNDSPRCRCIRCKQDDAQT